jgi:para-aminobenzoate synthetase component 2
VVEPTLPADLEVTATAATQQSRVVMALRHRTLPVEGVRFHPEAELAQGGHLLLANWLATRRLTAFTHV